MKKEEQQYISLAEAAKLTNYSQDYISLLCRQGKLKAEKLGRNWVTTKEWVYSYVDNTDGKGKSVVPVKIKEAVDAEIAEVEKEAPRRSKVRSKKPFFACSVLECFLFCAVFLIWTVNVYAFTNFLETGNFDAEGDYAGVSYVSPDDAILTAGKEIDDGITGANPDTADVIATDASGELTCTGCEVQNTLDDLLSFELETDVDVIAAQQKIIGERFGADMQATFYKGFAMLTNPNNPGSTYMYMFE